jgi:peptide/nickel transport system substrate-binding protein
VAAVKVEPSALGSQAPLPGGQSKSLLQGMFSAELGMPDHNDVAQPMLVEALPQLNSDDWRVFPDGRMETTYRLRPNLTWHDGTPLSAEDFVFSRSVFRTPQFGLANQPPFQAMEEVTAPDARTLVIQWRTPYPDAAGFTRQGSFPALPRHLLEAAFEAESPEVFANRSYWNREFVGLGPYRLDRWEPGSFLEASAFPGYVRGRPKIDTIVVRFINDANTALTNILAGDVILAGDIAVGVNQALLLKREWEGSKAGEVIMVPSQWRSIRFQFRPEYADPASILDVRVRRAMAHAVDRQGLIETLFSGAELPAESFVAPTSAFGVAAERVMTKYPYDLRRTEQLMNEVGYVKGADGFYASPTAGRFSPELKANASSENETEMTALSAAFRASGFDVSQAVNPAALAQDLQARTSYRTLFTNSTGVAVATAPNLFNYGGWTHPEYDRLGTALRSTLDEQERVGIMAQIVKLYSDELPAISLRFASHPWAVNSALTGFQIGPIEDSVVWNMHAWEIR